MVTGDFDFGIPYDRKAAILYDYEHDGFGYVKYPGNESYYGLSLSSPEWVYTEIAKLGGLRVVYLSEIAWVDFMFCFAVRSPPRLAFPPKQLVTNSQPPRIRPECVVADRSF